MNDDDNFYEFFLFYSESFLMKMKQKKMFIFCFDDICFKKDI